MTWLAYKVSHFVQEPFYFRASYVFNNPSNFGNIRVMILRKQCNMSQLDSFPMFYPDTFLFKRKPLKELLIFSRFFKCLAKNLASEKCYLTAFHAMSQRMFSWRKTGHETDRPPMTAKCQSEFPREAFPWSLFELILLGTPGITFSWSIPWYQRENIYIKKGKAGYDALGKTTEPGFV